MSVARLNEREDWVRLESGVIAPRKALAKKRPTCIDLFCGCGGFSCGLLDAGFEVLAGVDNWDVAAITYMVNLGSYPMQIHYAEPADKEILDKAVTKYCVDKCKDGAWTFTFTAGTGMISESPELPPVRHFFFGDVRKFSGKQILDALGLKQGEVTCVCGGPPCQGYSRAGKRQVMDPRNSLVFEFARLVCEIQPLTFMFENVPGILSMVTPEGFPVIDEFCRIMEDGGFGSMNALKKSLLNTSGTGAALKSHLPGNYEKQAKDEDGDEQEQLSLFQA